MNVIVDTNVLLSAALADRLPEKVVLFVATQDEWKWLVTPEILTEYVEVLKRPKFALATEVLDRWSELLAMRTINMGSPTIPVHFERDPKDAPFLAAALATSADFLITGDRDLLQVRGQVTTRIVTVAEFASEFGMA